MFVSAAVNEDWISPVKKKNLHGGGFGTGIGLGKKSLRKRIPAQFESHRVVLRCSDPRKQGSIPKTYATFQITLLGFNVG